MYLICRPEDYVELVGAVVPDVVVVVPDTAVVPDLVVVPDEAGTW